jgi:hypothetical protein
LARNKKCPFSYKALLLSDFTIPEDLDLHYTRAENSKPEMYFSLFGSLFINKRILSCTFHKCDRIYEYMIADKIPLYYSDNGTRDLAKIFKFLRNFKDTLTSNLKDVIIDWLCYSSYPTRRDGDINPYPNQTLPPNAMGTE